MHEMTPEQWDSLIAETKAIQEMDRRRDELMENANRRRLRCIGPDGAYAVCQGAFARSLGGAPAEDPRHVYAYYLYLATGRCPELEDTPDFHSLPHPDTVDFIEAARVHLGWK